MSKARPLLLVLAWTASLLALCLPVSAQHGTIDDSPASIALEMGADQSARRVFIPRLRFNFSLQSSTAFFDAQVIQRTNRDLQGEVDFWIRAGLVVPVAPALDIEAGLHHLSRHISSTDYPRITDANEGLVRLWRRAGGVSVGAGFGGYVWGRVDYGVLAVFNLRAPRLFGSEFSLAAEFKYAGFREIFYDLEISASLTDSADLFLRGTRHYEYPPTAYFGLRIKSGANGSSLIEHFRFRSDVLAWDSSYKLFAWQNVRLALVRRPDRRLTLNVESAVPIFRGDAFFGKFPPEWIRYPFCLEYEKPLEGGLRAFAYGSYDIIMPLDRAEEFRSSLGLGLGLRNQSHFDRLAKPVRFEMAAGWNFDHDFDVRFRLGINSVGRPTDIGLDAEVKMSPNQASGRLRVFAEIGGPVSVRAFLGLGRVVHFENGPADTTRFWVGLEFFRWFSRTEMRE
ncbi:MAG: hypothetical protein FJY83_08930 [Candidatus Aminicenantes bacterium]|nr:hypothetical protein [Candidatus Aminicenantes bacterium]